MNAAQRFGFAEPSGARGPLRVEAAGELVVDVDDAGGDQRPAVAGGCAGGRGCRAASAPAGRRRRPQAPLRARSGRRRGRASRFRRRRVRRVRARRRRSPAGRRPSPRRGRARTLRRRRGARAGRRHSAPPAAVVGPPAGEEDLLVSECAGDRERVFALPLAGAAADEHERQRPAEPRERLRVRPDQER